ncbi:MAG: FAD-binding oxidoreductase [Rhodobacteraceae bacterium]|nr:FAD-binding oxidoreductase [Paracoccaceae bacterium]
MPFTGEARIPDRTDVVVIGGGIGGLTTALHLREVGLRVTLCEKGVVGGEQTSRSMGWVTSLGDGPGRVDLSLASAALWDGYARDCGPALTFRRDGVLLACQTEAEVERFQAWIDRHDAAGGSSILRGAALAQRLGGTVPQGTIAGACQAEAGLVDPAAIAAVLAGLATARGAIVVQNCAVRGIERSAGRISAVLTEQGPIKAAAVVLAGGVWSRRFARSLGIDLPLLTARSTLARTGPVSNGPAGCGALPVAGWNALTDGSYLVGRNDATAPLTADSFRLFRQFLPALREMGDSVALTIDRDLIASFLARRRSPLDRPGPFEAVRLLANTGDPQGAETLCRDLAQAIPAFASTHIVCAWGGVIDVTPDRVPILGETSSAPGIYLCTGFSAHGLAMAPAAGRLIADQIAGRVPLVDPSPFSMERFANRAQRTHNGM